MSWGRVDDRSAFHPKVVFLGNAAWGALMRMSAKSSDDLTDGFVSHEVARVIASPEELERLQAKPPGGLMSPALHPVEGGFKIHDFHDYNPTREEVLKKRKAHADRQAAWTAKSAKKAKQGGGLTVKASRSDNVTDSVSDGVSGARMDAPTAPSLTVLPDPDPDPRSETHTNAGARDGAPTTEPTHAEPPARPSGIQVRANAVPPSKEPIDPKRELSAEGRIQAEILGITDVDMEWLKFRARSLAEDTRSYDWEASWVAWLPGAKRYQETDRFREKQRGGPAKPAIPTTPPPPRAWKSGGGALK